jgi:hypothetical protein
MAENEINLRALKLAVNSVLDHLIEDLGLENVHLDGTFQRRKSMTLRPDPQS